MKQLNIGNRIRKVRVLFGVTALFLLLAGMATQAAGVTDTWLANKGEWVEIKGYHLGTAAQTKSCGHDADDNYVIPVSIEGSGLMPDQSYLKDNYRAKGAKNKAPKKYKDQMDG